MENSENPNVNLGVKKSGKNTKKNHLQQTIRVRNNIKTRNRCSHPPSEEVHIVHKDEFKSFVQHMTGKEIIHSKPPLETTRLQRNRPPPLSIVRPQVPFQPDAEPPLVENPQTNIVESQTQVVNNIEPPETNGPQSPTSEFPIPWSTSYMDLIFPLSPYNSLLSLGLLSPPSSLGFSFPLFSPLSAAMFPFLSSKKPNDQ
ncbi:hypothetical protein P8452_56309 [Trifolium repens]|nr:hypothetical protein P8452_56309 [Trifolium repens]